MRRRDLLGLISTSAVWPMAARAQSGRVRRVAVLMNYPVHHPESEARLAAFRALMRQAGWTEGQNLQIDFYSGAGGPGDMRSAVASLVGLSPDVIVSSGTPATKAAQDATRSIPIVFANVADPVGAGIISSLPKPDGMTTGFVNYEYPMGGKWLETLKEIAPGVSQFAVIYADSNPSFVGSMREIQSAATRLQVQITAMPVRNEADIESSIDLLGRQSNVGLIVLPDGLLIEHRDLIVRLVARNKIPTIYSERVFTSIGGLTSYAYDAVAQFGQTASYVDRILKGTKPNELPVQQSVRFDLVINLKTAKALGLTVPQSLLARADEVIE